MRRIALLATRQNGIAGRDQLVGLGLSPAAIDSRVRSGRLRPYFRGVYLVGPVAPPLARETAAVVACGPGAVLSHRSAAALWRLTSEPAHDRPVDVTVPGRRPDGRSGVCVHWASVLGPGETTRLRRIPVTTPARTLLDLAAALPSRELEQAVATGERMHAGTQRRLAALLARYPRRAGTAKLRKLLDRSAPPAFTRSAAEERFLALIRRAQLPAPDVNVSIHGYEVDFLWREQALAVEIDGFAFHGDRQSFEADRRRDSDLAAIGIQTLRVTWRQIAQDSEATLVRVAQALSGRRAVEP